MSRLTNLKSLTVTSNHIHDLPRRIGDMAALEAVDFKNNDIEMIPYSILRCANLTKLNLMSNRLVKLPDLIGTMPALTKLDVAGNRLTMLPFSLGFSKTLAELFVHDNPLADPPVAECDKGIKHMMWYMRNRMHIVNRGMPPVMRYHQTGLQVRLDGCARAALPAVPLLTSSDTRVRRPLATCHFVTRHLSRFHSPLVTCHSPLVTSSLTTCHLTLTTCHDFTHHLSLATHHLSLVTRYLSLVTRYLSLVTRYLSRCHLSRTRSPSSSQSSRNTCS